MVSILKSMRFFISILAFVVSLDLFTYKERTIITNQEQFDNAITRVNNGEEMHWVLKKGEYFLKETIKSSAPLTIIGRNATITSALIFESKDAHREEGDFFIYSLNQPLGLFPIFYDEQGELIPISESVKEEFGVNYFEKDIVSSSENAAGANLFIHIPENLEHLRHNTFSQAFGYFDSGWERVGFTVEKSDWQVFSCTALNRCSTNNYMYDKTAYRKPVRFIIYNAERKPNAIFYDKEWLYVPKIYQKVRCVYEGDTSSQMPSISINSDVVLDGVRFVGYSNITVNVSKENCCEVRKCRFEKSLSSALVVKKQNGGGAKKAIIEDCFFYECGLYNGTFTSLQTSISGEPCIEVRNCKMIRYPSGWAYYKNTGRVIWVDGDVNIYNNVICNTCGAPVYFHAGKIEARGNVLYNDDIFNSHYERNSSSDWGFFYCDHLYTDTQKALDNMQHRILLEDNLMYGAYSYGGDARGIFIDDGRGDVICRGNIVLNSQLYSIDARNSSLTKASSIRNRYESNIVTTRYRLVAGEAVTGSNIPITATNILLTGDENVTGNIRVLEGDIRKTGSYESSCDGNKIYVSEDLYREIRRSTAWKSVKKFVKRK